VTTRPLPPHGTSARGYGSPGRRSRCNCDPCRTARNRHQKQARINRELGRSSFTTCDKAQAHLRLLHQTKSWDTLVEATGVHLSNLIAIYQGKRTKIRHETEAKILAVPATGPGDAGQYIDAIGSTRRLQALSYVGHSYTTLCDATGTSPNRILSIINGRQPTIRRALAERITAAYRQLAFSPPPHNKFTSRTRNLARNKGWHGPLAWDDIDDPNCHPEKSDPFKSAPKFERDPDRKAEIAHLDSLGESVASIAKQLGNSEKYVRDQLTAIRRERAARANLREAA
jgi:DNA-binding NarL/FixJ family response regulator